MTREHKLAMIVGFALVLVVGVLVSDHLSGARKARMANVDMAGQEIAGGEVDVAFGRKPEAPPQIQIAKRPEASFDTPTRDADLAEAEVPADRFAVAPSVEPGRALDTGAITFGETRAQLPPTAMATESAPRGDIVMGTPSTTIPGFDRVPGEQRLDSISPLGVEREIANLTNPAEELVTAPAPKTEKTKTRTVKEGDTLWSIADDVYGDGKLHKKLAEFNKSRLGSSGQLRVGASIMIPDKNVLLGKAPASTQTAEAPKTEKQPNSIAQKTEAAKKPGKNTYVVKAGDTLGAIAKRELGSTGRWEEILEANPDLDDENSIRAGMTIKIPR